MWKLVEPLLHKKNQVLDTVFELAYSMCICYSLSSVSAGFQDASSCSHFPTKEKTNLSSSP